MASTYIKLASVTVGSGGASSIDFTSIPSTYTDLVLKFSGRSSNPYIDIKFNNNTSNRSSLYLYGNGSSAGSGTQAGFLGIDSSTSNTANTFGNGEIYIPNYASSNNKSFSADSVQENNATSAEMYLTAGLWSDTTAINQVTIFPESSGTFSQYTTATLYGVLKYAETGTGSKAIGGTVTTAGGYTYHTFFSSGMFTPTTNITGAEVLVVAGGGGGGQGVPGGAGAGGLVYASSQSYTSGVNYAAIVGAGGAKASGFNTATSNGTNSVFAAGTVAIGGGGGSAYTAIAGGNGGSGGGGSAAGTAAGTGTAGQGNNGGASGSSYGGGGGGAGAAGGVGGTNSRGGDGGDGVSTYSAWGAATGTGQNVSGTYWYAGGGGGSPWGSVSANNFAGLGGKGGGGNGSILQAANGLPFTGGGAGGGDSGSTNGGSGIVIVRYTT